MTERITMYCGCYKGKSSATRAMRSWIGEQTSVTFPGISDRFETTTILREDMMTVTQLQGGWGVSITCTPSDLLCVIKGDDGYPKDVPYAEVAHWQDACTPLCKTPCGTFPYHFDTLEEAKDAGFSTWFTHDGVAIVADKTRAYAVRLRKAV